MFAVKKHVAALVVVLTALALSACEVEDTSNNTGGSDSSSSSRDSNYTVAQKNAISAAENYLDLGTGFSRFGLIKQLTAKVGSGFKRRDAVFAVNHIKVNWNKQAVMAAKNYLDLGTGFSRDGLIKQLTSKVGSGFTQAQAEFAAHKVGL